MFGGGRSQNGGKLWNLLVSGDSHTISYLDSGTGRDLGFMGPYAVVAFQAARPLAVPVRISLVEIDEVRIGRGTGGFSKDSEGGRPLVRAQVADDWMSSDHARLRRWFGGWRVEDSDSKNGTFVNGVRRRELVLADGDVIECGGTVILFRDRVSRQPDEETIIEAPTWTGEEVALATLCPPLMREFEALRRIAASDVPVILLGETGTGKEMTARALHALSGRGGEFVGVNCGALPSTLAESELFGHRKGAFSGATDDRLGLIRASHRGTLLLDEVAELPEPAQIKLLRVLQERAVVPIGETRPQPIDLRVVAATHKDLEAEVAAGRFRRDLYARLAGYELVLPPLRERREDLGMLIRTLLLQVAGDRADKLKFRRSAAHSLFAHEWPLNIRELAQALGAAVTLAGDVVDHKGFIQLGLEHLPQGLRLDAAGGAGGGGGEDAELRDLLEQALRRHGGNISAVARDLDKARIQIRRWCKRLGIDPNRYKP